MDLDEIGTEMAPRRGCDLIDFCPVGFMGPQTTTFGF